MVVDCVSEGVVTHARIDVFLKTLKRVSMALATLAFPTNEEFDGVAHFVVIQHQLVHQPGFASLRQHLLWPKFTLPVVWRRARAPPDPIPIPARADLC